MELKQWKYEEIRDFQMDGIVRLSANGNETAVNYINDVVYSEPDGIPLHLQILVPYSRNMAKRHNPCVVFVQGSAWRKQNVYRTVPLLAKLAERGYTTAIVEYRHSGIAAFPSPVIDARNAVRFLRERADEYNIDPDRMILSGTSSGGHTAVYAGLYHNDETEENAFPGVSAEVCGIINWYGSTVFTIPDSNPSTVNHLEAESPEGMEMGHIDLREHPEKIAELSLDCQIKTDTEIVPVLIFHGTKDRVVNTECSAILYNRLRETGHEASFYLIEGGDHGGAEFWTPQVLDIVEDFMKKCFAGLK